ncbi:MAG TPA: hypothetical protein VKB93_00785 [Thermoanaerobaculia bacterium]|nr:hypothetical protein [Thermoanaerobaculia bacterium]
MRKLLPLVLLIAASVSAQTSGRQCDLYRYRVQLYRPDNKQRFDLAATPQFATQAACERARDARAAANAKVVEFIRARQPQYEADKFGPCECDDGALTAQQRELQIRTAEEIRLRVRERLLDMNLPTDAEVVRALDVDPPITPLLATPRLVPPPNVISAAPVTLADDLKSTRTLDTSKPTIAALDLPLAEVSSGAAGFSPPEQDPGGLKPAAPQSEITVTEPPVEEQKVVAENAPAPSPNAPTEEEMLSAQDTAERFISYETQRIQNVLKASAAITDEEVKAKIFDACMQRIQLLSNLRLLIEGSGMRGRLATAARAAESESDRLGLMTKLFGNEVKKHWAPQDARDVVYEVESEVEAAPDRVLRDSSGKYTPQQKRHALYLVMARTQPSEDQRLWLSAVVEEFLR